MLHYLSENILFILELLSVTVSAIFGFLLVNAKEESDKGKRLKRIGLIGGLIFTIFFKSLQYKSETKENREAMEFRKKAEKDLMQNIRYLQQLQYSDSIALDTINRIKDTLQDLSQKQFELFRLAGLASFPVKQLTYEISYSVSLQDLIKDNGALTELPDKIEKLHSTNSELFTGNFHSKHYATVLLNKDAINKIRSFGVGCPIFIKLYFHGNPKNTNETCVAQANIDFLKQKPASDFNWVELNFEKDTATFFFKLQNINIIPFEKSKMISSLKQLDDKFLRIGGIQFCDICSPDFDIIKKLANLSIRIHSDNSSFAISTNKEKEIGDDRLDYYKLTFR
jgi:hypothetical protein